MKAEEHRDYERESKRLNITLKNILKSMKGLANRKVDGNGRKVELQLRKMVSKKLKALSLSKKNPYFGRIDFKEAGQDNIQKLYIGKTSLIREEDNKLIIVDWRSPVASMYYDSSIGDASYVCPDGKIDGKLLLKRQYSIDNAKLLDISDVNIAANDELLAACLNGNKDNRLKDIVSTIQADQNRIIRASMNKPLIIQGVAGSGKTTIALHRIAYLAYTHEKTVRPKEFMIIAPNKLFLNYISNVLPDLGVNNVKQTTLEELAVELIGEKLKIKDPHEKLSDIVEGKQSESLNFKSVSELKTSLKFRHAVETYLKTIEKSMLPDKDFVFESFKIFKHQDIKMLFETQYNMWPLAYRVGRIKKSITDKFNTFSEGIADAISRPYYDKVQKLKISMPDSEKRQKMIIKIYDERDEKVKNLKKEFKTSLNKYLPDVKKTSVQYYQEFINNQELLENSLSGQVDTETIKGLQSHTEAVLSKGHVEVEDLAPLMHIKDHVYGLNKSEKIKHVVIDEAQDVGVYQFNEIKNSLKDSSFTILGDISQGIHSHRGTKSWGDLKQSVFGENGCEIIKLDQSYRTSVEIMNAANKVISKSKDPNIVLAKPVLRHGEQVKVVEKKNPKEIIEALSGRIDELKGKYKTVAIVCKTQDECKKVYSKLHKFKDEIQMINGKEKEYAGGVVIVPSYLSKGLEFDAVIVADASSKQYRENELDAKLLYVTMTRALHELEIYYENEITPLLRGVKAN